MCVYICEKHMFMGIQIHTHTTVAKTLNLVNRGF